MLINLDQLGDGLVSSLLGKVTRRLYYIKHSLPTLQLAKHWLYIILQCVSNKTEFWDINNDYKIQKSNTLLKNSEYSYVWVSGYSLQTACICLGSVPRIMRTGVPLMLPFILFLNRHGNNGFRYIFIPYVIILGPCLSPFPSVPTL